MSVKMVTAEAHEEKQVKHSGKEEGVQGQSYPVGGAYPLPVPHATVVISGGATIPTGNYRNVRVGVELHVPCPVDQIDEAYGNAKDWVDDRMSELVSEAEAAIS